jgi:hypothetical protein
MKKGSHHTEESKHKVSIAKRANPSRPWLGKKRSLEDRLKMSAGKGSCVAPFGASHPERSKIYASLAKKQVFDHYGWKCICCGETTPQFLSVDHVENDGFKLKTSTGKRVSGTAVYRIIIKEGFGPRYQILCMNCNYGKNINGGTCPHNMI